MTKKPTKNYLKDLQKKYSKKSNGLPFVGFAPNPGRDIAIFNELQGLGDPSNSIVCGGESTAQPSVSSGAIAEDSKPSERYSYNGTIKVWNGNQWDRYNNVSMETMAVSRDQARNFIIYKFRQEYGIADWQDVVLNNVKLVNEDSRAKWSRLQAQQDIDNREDGDSNFFDPDREGNYMVGDTLVHGLTTREAFDKLDEALIPQHAYMLRRSGEMIDLGDDDIHPYILIEYDDGYSAIVSKICDSMYDDEPDAAGFNSIVWQMNHTEKESVRNLDFEVINSLVKLVGGNVADYISPNSKYIDNISNAKWTKDARNLASIIKVVSRELDQEFCRARMSDMVYWGNGNDIYFRISSTGVNWYDAIWTAVSNNKSTISTITVVRDDDRQKYLKCSGLVLDHVTKDEFLTLPGNPVLEHKEIGGNFGKKLSKGSSLYEALGYCNIVRAKQYIEYLFRNNEENLFYNESLTQREALDRLEKISE